MSRSFIAVARLLAICLFPVAASAQAPEVRGMWISRFEWPSSNAATAQANLVNALDDLQAANFNAAFLQVRGQADVLYPSPSEVWSPLIGGTDPGWDPLAFAVNAAHDRGIELHAYINAHTCWQSGSHTPPSNPNHLFYAHCNAADVAHRDWLHHDNAANPVQYSENDYVWIAPGVPAFQAYFREQILHVVANYAVDGIHYDRIRTPWSNQPSFDPISVARHADPQSNPNSLSFSAWTADQITRMVRDTYAAAMEVRPTVKFSAAVYSNPATAPSAQHQDALAWIQTGAMDQLVPMMYFAGGAGSTWDSRLATWMAGRAGRHIIAGHITSQGGSSLVEQVALTRTRGAHGNCVFSWSSFSFWNNYTAGVYATPAPVPSMPWKTGPTTGIILGAATNTVGDGVVDAQVTRSGSPYIALTSGDGFYSFLLVPPGTYTLTFSHPAHGQVQIQNVSVAAGQVVRRNVVLGAPQPPTIAEVTPDPASVVEGQEYVHQLALASGSADSWTLIDGPPGAAVSSTGRVSGWRPSAGEAGTVESFIVRATNSAGSDDESWSVSVLAAPPCDRVSLMNFESTAVGQRTAFNLPRFSGSTSGHLAAAPNVCEVAADDAFGGDQSTRVEWQFVDAGANRWMRLTTFNAPDTPNPTIALDRPIRLRLRLDSGRLRVCIGVRETNTSAALGGDGGTSGTIEWIGAATDVSQSPQGVIAEPMPGQWQTLIFDPLTDPIHGLTGDGSLASTTGKAVLEHIAFTAVDSVGPFTVYVDDVEILCGLPAYGDFDGDGDITAADAELFFGCMDGPQVQVGSPCDITDADGDGDVDLHDFSRLQRQ